MTICLFFYSPYKIYVTTILFFGPFKMFQFWCNQFFISMFSLLSVGKYELFDFLCAVALPLLMCFSFARKILPSSIVTAKILKQKLDYQPCKNLKVILGYALPMPFRFLYCHRLQHRSTWPWASRIHFWPNRWCLWYLRPELLQKLSSLSLFICFFLY